MIRLYHQHVAAGFINHCACITETNHVFVWGKHTVFGKKITSMKTRIRQSWYLVYLWKRRWWTKAVDLITHPFYWRMDQFEQRILRLLMVHRY